MFNSQRDETWNSRHGDANSVTNSVHVQMYGWKHAGVLNITAILYVCSNQQWFQNQDNKTEHLRPTSFRHTAHEGSAIGYRRDATLLGFKMGETGKT